MNGTEQKIRGQTVDKTMAKPADVVKNQQNPIIWNKATWWIYLLVLCWQIASIDPVLRVYVAR